MNRPIIEVEKLSKKYRLGVVGATTLRDEIARWRRRRNGDSGEIEKGEFWALRDVSFSVQAGEVVGIIGRNGAGKSTLLKLLSRVTEPTSGRAVLRGRVASLLEVGTGFHPDLTGRENVFLNGAILGMKRAEIKSRFDEIVSFAEVEKFIDTPVKHYSSGMYVRLAFAVAAHLEPEILIVDEVLAVGDAQFQKKCLGKMSDVAGHGRTILFVTHNLGALRSLCPHSILLNSGSLVAMGSTIEVAAAYLNENAELQNHRSWRRSPDRPGNEYVQLVSIAAASPDGTGVVTIDTGVSIVVEFYCRRPGINLDCTIYISNSEGVLLLESGSIVSCNSDSQVGLYRVSTILPPHLLNSGRYVIRVLFGQNQHHILFSMDDVVAFEVEHTTTGRGANLHAAPGVIRPLLEWKNFFLRDAQLNS